MSVLVLDTTSLRGRASAVPSRLSVATQRRRALLALLDGTGGWVSSASIDRWGWLQGVSSRSIGRDLRALQRSRQVEGRGAPVYPYSGWEYRLLALTPVPLERPGLTSAEFWQREHLRAEVLAAPTGQVWTLQEVCEAAGCLPPNARRWAAVLVEAGLLERVSPQRWRRT